MSSDILHDSLRLRVQALVESKVRLTALRDVLAKDLASKEAEVLSLNREVLILTKVGELFKALMDQMVDKQVQAIEKLANQGFSTVMPSEKLSLEADVDLKYNKVSVEFFFRKGPKEHPRSYRDRPLSAFGGGASSFVSLILRVLAVKKLGLYPLLILDESLGAVSDDFISPVSKFVRLLCEEAGLDIMLVTHKSAFLEHAHAAYRCSREVDAGEDEPHVSMRKLH